MGGGDGYGDGVARKVAWRKGCVGYTRDEGMARSWRLIGWNGGVDVRKGRSERC